MYTINGVRKQHQQFSVYNIEGKKVNISPHIEVNIGGRTTVILDQAGEYVVNHTEEEVLRLHHRGYSRRFVDTRVKEKWEEKHLPENCKVCNRKKRTFDSLRAIPDDLNIDLLFGDDWRNYEDNISPERRIVHDSLFYMELMDLKNIKLSDPVDVEKAIKQLQSALQDATKAIKGENTIWAYHRKVLAEFITSHENEMATLAGWVDKSAYYHKKALTFFKMTQIQRKKIFYLKTRMAKSTIEYKISNPDLAFTLCPLPLDCDGTGTCCLDKKQLGLEVGCVICPYPSCLHCLDIRHRM